MYAKLSVYTTRINFKIEIRLFFSFAVKYRDAYLFSRYDFCLNRGENKYIRIIEFKLIKRPTKSSLYFDKKSI